MALTKKQKEEVVEKVKNIAQSESVVFANFHGLPIDKEQTMRQKLKDLGINYTVVKKRLAKLALADSKIEGEIPPLEGELSIAYGDDPVAPAREINNFIKEFKEGLSIIGGIFEKRYMNAEEMQTIASIPSINVLYSQVVNLINSPIRKLVIVLDQVAEKRG